MMRFAVLALLVFATSANSTMADDELKRSTWLAPTQEAIRAELETWIAESSVPGEQAQQILRLWDQPIAEPARLDVLAAGFAIASEDAATLLQFCKSARTTPELPDFGFLQSSETLPFVRNNLRLVYGRWLAQNELYDETLDQLEEVKAEAVIDPASLLFYKSIAFHRLLRKKECLPVVEKLLEREEELPRRFGTLAKLIQADIAPLEADSLDEVSRMMDSIKVRLGHGRAGKRVRKEEDDVIAKLDKMIKDLEDKAKQQQQAAASSGKAGDTLNPSQPMNDSMPGGATGPGNVDPTEITKKAGWGDLPPKERQQALQQLGKEFPSHYRDVIEEYFIKLAREGADPQ